MLFANVETLSVSNMAKGEHAISNRKVAKRRRLSPEARKKQLLEVAVSVFAKRGLAGAHHAEIAERAGVAVSTVFVYFPTRPALVDAVLCVVETMLWEITESTYNEEHPSAAHALRVHFARALETAIANPDIVAVWLDWSTAVRTENWPRFLEGHDRLAALMTLAIQRGQTEGSLRADLDADHVARHLIGSSRSIAQMLLMDVDEAELRAFIETLLRALEPVESAPAAAPN